MTRSSTILPAFCGKHTMKALEDDDGRKPICMRWVRWSFPFTFIIILLPHALTTLPTTFTYFIILTLFILLPSIVTSVLPIN